MGRGYEEEKLFSEKIDRFLAGEEIQADGAVSEDFKTALDFAQQIALCRKEPAPQFKANLKARLLQKLDEQEDRAEERRGWLSRLMHQPIWQAAAVVVFMVIVGGVAWGSGVFNPSGSGPIVNAPTPAYTVPAATTAAPKTTTAASASSAPATSAAPTTAAPATSAPTRYLTASASTNKSAYLPGEIISIHMEWQNVSSQTLTIDEFPPILSIMDKSTGQAVLTFQAGKAAITLAPGQKADYIEAWNQLDARGRPVTAGDYYLELEEMYYQGRAVPMPLNKPVNFTIY